MFAWLTDGLYTGESNGNTGIPLDRFKALVLPRQDSARQVERQAVHRLPQKIRTMPNGLGSFTRQGKEVQSVIGASEGFEVCFKGNKEMRTRLRELP